MKLNDTLKQCIAAGLVLLMGFSTGMPYISVNAAGTELASPGVVEKVVGSVAESTEKNELDSDKSIIEDSETREEIGELATENTDEQQVEKSETTEKEVHLYMNFHDTDSGDSDKIVGLYSDALLGQLNEDSISVQVNSNPEAYKFDELEGFPKVYLDYAATGGKQQDVTEECMYNAETGIMQIPAKYYDDYITVKVVMGDNTQSYQELIPNAYRITNKSSKMLRSPATDTSQFEVIPGSCNDADAMADTSNLIVGQSFNFTGKIVTLDQSDNPNYFMYTGTTAYQWYKGEGIGYAITIESCDHPAFVQAGNAGSGGSTVYNNQTINFADYNWLYGRCIQEVNNNFDGNPVCVGGKIYVTDIAVDGTLTCWFEMYTQGPSGQAAQNTGMYFKITPSDGTLLVDKGYYDMDLLISSDDYEENLNLSATFGIYANSNCASGSKVGEIKTDRNGKSRGAGLVLPDGTYYVKELIPPKGFAINETIFTVKLGANKTKKLTIKDRIFRASIIGTKIDANTGKATPMQGLSLAGAIYTVYSDTGCKNKVGSGATNVAGKIDFGALFATGTYYIKETKAPSGYQLDSKVHKITINESLGLKDSTSNNYQLRDVTFISEDAPDIGTAQVQKVSSNQGITENNKCYSRAGAEFQLIRKDNGVVISTKLVTGLDGNSQVLELPIGEYTVKETKAPRGYCLNTNTITVKVEKNKTTTFKFEDDPMNDPAAIELTKIDAETGESIALGTASLAGTQFTIKYYDGYYTEATLPNKATRTWILETKSIALSNGSIRYACRLSEEYKVTGDNFYKIKNDVVLPLGTITVEETKAPAGYLLDGHQLMPISGGTKTTGIYVSQITSENDAVNLKGGNQYSISDKVIRGDLKFIKVGESALDRLSNVPFKITSKTTSESYTVITDKNGQIDTSSSWNKHSNNTNAGKTPDDGIWFSGSKDTTVPVNDVLGALPYDTYILEEQRCDNNKGYNLLTVEVSIYKDKVMVDMGTLTDSVLAISTKANDDQTGTNYSSANGDVSITDEVSYTGLEKGKEYKLIGTIMDKQTGSPFLDKNGKAVTIQTTFTAKATKGSTKVNFTFDATSLVGKDIVVFEELYLGSAKVAEHMDINDQDQTIHFPEIGTKAIDESTNTNMANANEKIVIVDTVTYKNLQVGKKYTMSGTLMDKETGKVVSDVKGHKVTAETTFTPTTESGSIDVKFIFDGSNLAGRTLVAFEELKQGNNLYAVHADIEDEGQTIYLPEIKTTAKDSQTNNHIANAAENVTIIDKVTYANLIPGKEYIVSGVLMDKDTEKPIRSEGKEVTAEKAFTPEKANGIVELQFTLNTASLAGKTIVVFEQLLWEGKEVATHTDIKDKGQTIYIPEIKTTAQDADSKTQYAFAEKDMTIVDTISYTNLIPGKEYLISGILMDLGSGSPLLIDGGKITVEKTFIPANADGTVELEFNFNGSALAGQTIVVFETLYFEEKEIATHTDIQDKNQTIYFPQIKTQAIDNNTNSNVTKADKKIVIVDTVTYKNLQVGKKYAVTGTLMDKKTGETVRDVKGDKVTAETTFKAKTESGSVAVEFKFDGSELGGKTLVAFEELKQGTKLYAVHADLEDEAQTIYIPQIGTTATAGGKHETVASGEIIIKDKVAYKNLKAGNKYKIAGVLMDQGTNKPLLINGQKVTAEKKFTAKESQGSLEIDFKFNGDNLVDKKIVVFEKLYIADTKIEIANHEDINDRGQTVRVVAKKTETSKIVTPKADTPKVAAPKTNNLTTTAKAVKTGDGNVRTISILAAVSLASAGIITILLKKKKESRK